jgi:hypothetical protein
MHIASGFDGSAGVRALEPAEAIVGELGKAQTTKKTNLTMKKPGSALRVCADSSSCDASPIGVIRDKVVPMVLMNRFKFGFACGLYLLRGLDLSTSVLRPA